MILYLLRHAIAVPRGSAGVSDEERVLTEEGIVKMQQAAAGLRKAGLRPAAVLSSPLARARQTANIVVAVLGGKIPLEITAALAPDGTRSEIYAEIRRHQKYDQIMMVGHQPSLGELAGALCWGSPDHYVELKKAGVCAVDLDLAPSTPRGTLLFLMTPAILRGLGQRKR